VAVLAHNSPGSINSARGFIQVAVANGLPVPVQSFDVPLGTFDATALAIQMKEAGVNSIYAPTLTDSSVSVLRAAQQQGLKIVVPYVSSLYDPGVAGQVNDYIQGVITTPVGTVPNELDLPAVRAYREAMAAHQPATDPSSGFTEAGYLSADLFIRGVEDTVAAAGQDCVTRDGFVENLRKVTDYEGSGLLVGPAAFTGGDAPNGGSRYGSCVWFVTRTGNTWQPDPAATCGTLEQIAAP
jgi:branched-chain amino acid transport system substrate-binding protein